MHLSEVNHHAPESRSRRALPAHRAAVAGDGQCDRAGRLDKVLATGAVIVVSWPKVKDALGFPARAFAILP
jgi:kynurenine formamidase